MLFAKYKQNNEIKEVEMGRAYIAYGGEEEYVQDFGVTARFTLLLLYPRVRRLGGPQSQCSRCGEEKNCCLSQASNPNYRCSSIPIIEILYRYLYRDIGFSDFVHRPDFS
jgi:hypothetical protein